MLFSHCCSIYYAFLPMKIIFAHRFLPQLYLSLPHLPWQLSPCASLCPLLSLKKQTTLNQRLIWIRERKHWVIKLPFSPTLFHLFQALHPSSWRDLIWGEDVGGKRKHEEMWRSKNGRKERLRSMCLPPLCTVRHREKRGTSNGLRRSPVQTSQNGRNDCRNAFLLRGCWDLTSENEKGCVCLSVWP